MKQEKLKRFTVTQCMRFPSPIVKVIYYGGFALIGAGIIIAVVDLILQSKAFLGAAIIGAILGFIWIIASRFISENSFGYANVSFTEDCIIFRSSNGEDAAVYKLRWDDCRTCGVIKTRRTWWCFVSDHELSKAERKEFPENVEEGVFYFCYAANTWEEFMKFVPERFRAYLEAEKSANRIR